METLLGVLLLIGIIIAFLRNKDRKLLLTVTKPNRGTPTEREAVLTLLKSGIPAQTIFHDLYIQNRKGDYTQIDLVVATKVGIIVIEVKNYSGWIFGNGNHFQWTQVMAYGNRKFRFYNPVFQNRKHIADLKNQLPQFERIPFYSVIVFYGNFIFKNVSFVPNGTFLIKSERMLEVIQEITRDNPPASYSNKREIVLLLAKGVENGDNIAISTQHIENIKDMHSRRGVFN